MSGFFIFINSLLKKKFFWAAPFVLFILVLVPRFFKVSFVSNNFSSIFNILCMFFAFMFAFLFLFVGLKDLFSRGEALRKEVLFYKSFGLGLIQQFFMRVLVLSLWSALVYFMSSAVMWTFNLNMMLLIFTMGFSLVLFSCLSIFLNNRLFYYIPVALYTASIFYPMYIIPNPAYVLNSNLNNVFIYSSMYVLFYVLASYKLYILSWRKQCTTLIS